MDGYQMLANAIIETAARDYCDALIRLYKLPDNSAATAEKKELESFFRSSFYAHLTEIDGEELITMLQAKARHKLLNRKKKGAA